MSLRGIAVTGVLLVAAVSVTAGQAGGTSALWPPAGRFDQPQTGFAPAWTVLREGSPQEAGLAPEPIATSVSELDGWTRNQPATGHPMFSGQVTLLAHDGVVVTKEAAGYALRYSDQQGDPLPADQWIPMRTDTIFDLASLSKLFTCIVAMQQIQAGRLDLNATVAGYLPEFATNGKGAITIKELMTHTSGLPADPPTPLWQYPDLPSRIHAILDVTPQYAPGSTYLYSDMNMMTLQQVVQKITGKTLDVLVRDGITAPLGMRDTMYNPPASLKPRIAAQEYELVPDRGLVWGQVHDENAWALGGVAGHAGVFSTVDDMAVLAQSILNGGTYRGHRILSRASVTEMLTDYNQAYPGNSHGLGFELDQRWYMGRLDSPMTAGHTGFTGTTIVIDPESRSFALQFSNRVHPTRNWGSTNPARRAAADGLANAMAVRAPDGQPSWYSGIGDASAATLSTPTITTRGQPVSVSYTTFVDTELDSDLVTLQASTDGGTTWTVVPVTATGPGAPGAAVNSLSGGSRQWWRVRAELPASSGPLELRWQYVTDPSYTGRGVDVTDVTVADRRGPLFVGDRDQRAFTGVNWELTSR